MFYRFRFGYSLRPTGSPFGLDLAPAEFWNYESGWARFVCLSVQAGYTLSDGSSMLNPQIVTFGQIHWACGSDLATSIPRGRTPGARRFGCRYGPRSHRRPSAFARDAHRLPDFVQRAAMTSAPRPTAAPNTEPYRRERKQLHTDPSISKPRSGGLRSDCGKETM